MIERPSLQEQFARVNALELWDYEVHRPEPGTVLILGGNDLTYSHHLELEFHGVLACDLPPTFSHARFRLADDGQEMATVWVTPEYVPEVVTPEEYEVQASEVIVRIGTVSHYDRGSHLQGR